MLKQDSDLFQLAPAKKSGKVDDDLPSKFFFTFSDMDLTKIVSKTNMTRFALVVTK